MTPLPWPRSVRTMTVCSRICRKKSRLLPSADGGDLAKSGPSSDSGTGTVSGTMVGMSAVYEMCLSRPAKGSTGSSVGVSASDAVVVVMAKQSRAWAIDMMFLPR